MRDYLNPHGIHPERLDGFPGFDSIRPGVTGSIEDFIRELIENGYDEEICPTCGQTISVKQGSQNDD